MNLLPILAELTAKERSYGTFDFGGKIIKIISGAFYTLAWFFYRLIAIFEDIIKFLMGISKTNSVFKGENIVSLIFPKEKVLLPAKWKEIPALKFIMAMILFCILMYVIVVVYGIIKGNLKGDTKLQRKVMVSSPKVLVKMVLVPIGVVAVILFISTLIGYTYDFLFSYISLNENKNLASDIFHNNFENITNGSKTWNWQEISRYVDYPNDIHTWNFKTFDNAINTYFGFNGYEWYPLDIVSGQVFYQLAIITGLAFLYGMVKIGYKLLIRTFKLTFYIGLAPYVIMQEPIDKGVKYENWKKEILNTIIGAFSYLLAFILAFVVIATIKEVLKIIDAKIVKIIFSTLIYISVGISMPLMADKINAIITSGIGGEDSNITGGESDTNILGGNIASKLNPASKIKTKLSGFNDKKKQNRSFKKGSKDRQNSKNGLKSRFMNTKFGKKVKGGWKSTKKGFSLLGKKIGNTKDNLLHGKVGTSKRRLFEAKRLKKAKYEAQKQQAKFEKIKQKRANGQISRTQFLDAKNRVKKASEKAQKHKDNYKEQLQEKSRKESKFKQYKIQEKMGAYNGDKPKNNSKKGNQLE